jgi:hypothetical protein
MRTDRQSDFEYVFYCDPWDGRVGISHPRFVLLYRCRLRGSDRADGTRRLQHHRLGSSEGFVAGDDEAGPFVAGRHQLEKQVGGFGLRWTPRGASAALCRTSHSPRKLRPTSHGCCWHPPATAHRVARRASPRHPHFLQCKPQGSHCVVQPRLHRSFGDIEICSNLRGGPSAVVGPLDHGPMLGG